MKYILIPIIISLLSIEAIQLHQSNREKKLWKTHQHKEMWNDVCIPLMNEIYCFVGLSLMFLMLLVITTITSIYQHLVCKNNNHLFCIYCKNKV
jgi:hypothetical protein